MALRRNRIRREWAVLRTAGWIALGLALALRAEAGYVWVDFEGVGETKTGYATGTNVLSGLTWELTDVLIGTSAADWKNGARSARLRGYGTSAMTLLEDMSNGVSNIAFKYRRYDTNAQRAWQVEYSADGGETWTAAGESFTAPASDDVQTFSAEINVSEPARIRIRAAETTSTSEHRLNIDDILIIAYDAVPAAPVVQTGPIADIEPDSATAGGALVYDGNAAVIERGVALNTTGAPTTNDTVYVAESGNIDFSVTLTNLVAGIKYYARAYAVNSEGVGYGSAQTFYAARFIGAPVALPPEPVNRNSFRLRWTGMAGAEDYRLDVARAPCFSRGEHIVVFRETFGYVSATTPVATHWINGGFDTAYAFGSGGADLPADIRVTSKSSGYENPIGYPASGWANVFFPWDANDYGFGMDDIEVPGNRTYRLSFGYRKESTTTNAAFAVAWSIDNGVTWHPLVLNDLPDDNAGTGWRLIHTEPWTFGTDEPVSMGLRWIKTGGVAMRIDDIVLERDGGSDSLLTDYNNRSITDTSHVIENLEIGRYLFRVRAVGADYCVSSNSNIRAFGVSHGTIIMTH